MFSLWMRRHFECVLILTVSQDPTRALFELIPHSKHLGYQLEDVMVAPSINSEDASAKDVLQQCARNLINVAQQVQSCDRVTQTSQMSPTANRQTNVLQEHRALFGFVPPSGGQTRSSTNSRAKYPKKRVIFTPSGRIPIPVRDTFTKPFVCLANKDQTVPPSVQEKIQLGLAELGVFERYGDSKHVHEKLLDEFPQLSDCGRYEVLRSHPGSRDLTSIPMPPGGYTVAFLRNVLGQAKGQRLLEAHPEGFKSCS